SNTRMGLKAKGKINDDLSIGGKIEYAVRGNSSDKVNQFHESNDAEIDFRQMFVSLESKTAGTLSLGQGDTASNGTAEMDLSGTGVVVYSGIGDMAGGLLLSEPGVPVEKGGLKIGKTIGNMDGLSRKDRIRYDTPSFGGFSLSASAVEKDAYDVGARFTRKFGDNKIAAAVAWASGGDLKKYDDQIDGSISFLHSSGFNITLAGGQQNYDEGGKEDPTFWYTKLGYRAHFFSIGETAFSVDYGQWNDFHTNDDETDSIGVGIVQSMSDWGTQFYLAYRNYDLDSVGHNYDAINAVMAGARIKF
ncbi:MAG TPA: porin, partial [Desulfobulbus sp.]|nr:porin [Desulfobulbus sp.]